MPIDRTTAKLKSRTQMILALELKLSGATYEQIGKSLSPPVSHQRAHIIVLKGLEERIQDCHEIAEKARMIELARLDRWMLALEPKKSDPRTVDTLLRLSERRAKLLGLDAPQRLETTGANGGPIETVEAERRLDKLSFTELLHLEALENKARGIANYDEHLRSEEQHRRACYPNVDPDWIAIKGPGRALPPAMK